MTNDKLVWAETLIAEVPVPRKIAYGFSHMPFAHVIDGELYYEVEPLGHCCRGFAATSAEEYDRSFRLMRETTAGGWEEAIRRRDAGGREAARAAAKRGLRRRRPRASNKIGSPLNAVHSGLSSPAQD